MSTRRKVVAVVLLAACQASPSPVPDPKLNAAFNDYRACAFAVWEDGWPALLREELEFFSGDHLLYDTETRSEGTTAILLAIALEEAGLVRPIHGWQCPLGDAMTVKAFEVLDRLDGAGRDSLP